MNFETIKKILSSIVNFTKTYILVIGVLITLIFCSYSYISVMSYGKDVSKNFSSKHDIIFTKDTIINNKTFTYLYDTENKIGMIINPKKHDDLYSFTRIISQLKVVKQRELSHSKAIDYFIINLYYFIIIQTIFMVFVLLLGVIISKKGWGDSSTSLLATFLICAGFLLFFQILPKGMKFEENLASNRAHYIMYCDMENRILSYLSADKIDDTFINDMDDQLKNYHSVSFDLQQVPFSEVQKQFKEIKGASEDNNSKPKVYNNYIVQPTYKEEPKLQENVMVERSVSPLLDSTINDTTKNNQ